MAKKELTVDVEARLIVSRETAERCLRILEMWQEDHPQWFIEGTKGEDGKTKFRIAPRLLDEEGNRL